MGGWMSHLAAIEAWLAVVGELPVHVKLVIEGEEEIGSPNLERYMDAFPDVFTADVMVLTDCENPSTEVPGLTVSLRGLLELELAVEALEADVHSGLWGNMVPDPATALILLLARLLDEHGRLALGRREVPETWRRAAAAAPPSRELVAHAAPLLPGVPPLPDEGRPPAEWLWRQPALTVLSTTLPRPSEQKNAVRRRASATLSIRLAPGQTAAEMLQLLEAVLLVNPPGGVRVMLLPRPGGAQSWLYEPSGPVFDAVDRAYEKGFGQRPVQVGVGGSIPFVALFGRRFSHLPLVLNGVMDPETGAHGPNESLHLGVFEKTLVSNVYLLEELGRLPVSSCLLCPDDGGPVGAP
jgi:acetylornithine deacetylase/succinyl-diaminopimelate desuccinylase-like protein